MSATGQYYSGQRRDVYDYQQNLSEFYQKQVEEINLVFFRVNKTASVFSGLNVTSHCLNPACQKL